MVSRREWRESIFSDRPWPSSTTATHCSIICDMWRWWLKYYINRIIVMSHKWILLLLIQRERGGFIYISSVELKKQRHYDGHRQRENKCARKVAHTIWSNCRKNTLILFFLSACYSFECSVHMIFDCIWVRLFDFYHWLLLHQLGVSPLWLDEYLPAQKYRKFKDMPFFYTVLFFAHFFLSASLLPAVNDRFESSVIRVLNSVWRSRDTFPSV